MSNANIDSGGGAAALLPYNNAASGLAATTYQNAIDELAIINPTIITAATYTVLPSDEYLIIDASLNNVAVTLPDATTVVPSKRVKTIKMVDITNPVTLVAGAGLQIEDPYANTNPVNNVASLIVQAPAGASFKLYSDGVSWKIV